MKQRICILMVVGLFFGVQGMAQRDSLAYRLTPFVKGGLSIGFFDNSISQESSVGHTGFHIDIGLQIPFQRGDQYGCCLVPSLRFITKGETWDNGENGRASVSMQYIEMPIDFAFRAVMKKSSLLAGGGFYLAYGIGGRMTGSDGLYIFRGYRLKDRLKAFGSELGFMHWDAGINLMTEYQIRHLCLSADIDIGLVRVPPTRFNGDNKSSNVAVSLGIGYLF